MKEKQKEASITVEAVFVIPIVIFTIFALIYLAFYLHDRVRTEEIVERSFNQAEPFITQRSAIGGAPWEYENLNKAGSWGYFRDSSQEQEKKIYEYLEEELSHGFFLLEPERIICKTEGFVLKIQVNMKGRISLNPVKSFLGETPEFVLERKIPLHSPEEVLRVYDGLEIVMDHIDAFHFAKNHADRNKAVLEGVD